MGLFSFFRSKAVTATIEKNPDTDLEEGGDGDESRIVKGRTGLKNFRILEQVFFTNPDEGTEFDDKFYRNLNQTGALDLPPEVLHRGMRLSMLLYRKNVRAKNAIELVTDFALGDGMRFNAGDPRVQNVLNKHWSVNDWEEKLPERIRSLAIFGEWIFPAFVRESDGLVRVSSITPLRLLQVRRDKEDASTMTDLLVASKETNVQNTGTQSQGDPMAIIRKQDDTFELKGESFFFAVNRVDGVTRGIPDLLASVDWLEGLDGFIFSLMERAALAEKIVWDLQCEGLNAKELLKKAKQFRDLASGEVYAHNERVQLGVKAPDIGASEAKEVVGIILRQIQSGTRLAGLFFGDSADLTRASASELAVPVSKMIQGRQNFIKRSFRKIFDFVIQEAVKAGTLKDVEDLSYTIDMPNVFLRDLATLTTALSNLGISLQQAEEQGWIDSDEAAKVYRSMVESLGIQMSQKQTSSATQQESEELLGYERILDRGRGDDGNGSDLSA